MIARGVLVLAVAIVSLLWWRSDTDICTCEWCPDGYCSYAEAIRSAVAGDPGRASRLGDFARAYTHAHSALAPTAMALPMLARIEAVPAYAMVSAVATLLAWLAVSRAITAAWNPQPLVRGLAFVLFFANALVVRAFARPLTDAVGLSCTAWSLTLLQRHRHSRSRATASALFVAQLV